MRFWRELLLLIVCWNFPPVAPMVRRGAASRLAFIALFLSGSRLLVDATKYTEIRSYKVGYFINMLGWLSGPPFVPRRHRGPSPHLVELLFGLYFYIFGSGWKGWDEMDHVVRDLILGWYFGKEELQRMKMRNEEKKVREGYDENQQKFSEREAWLIKERERAMMEWEESTREARKKELMEIKKKLWEENMREDEKELEKRRSSREGRESNAAYVATKEVVERAGPDASVQGNWTGVPVLDLDD